MGSLSRMHLDTTPSILPDAPLFPGDALNAEEADILNTEVGGETIIEEMEEAIPAATIQAVGTPVVALRLPSALSVLAEQYLNEHTGGFTVAHARTLSFEELMKELRKKKLIKQIRDILQQIHARSFLRHNVLPDAATPLTINTRIIVAAFMVYLHPGKVFETVGVIEAKLIESSTVLLTTFERILQQLSTVRFNDLDAQLTEPFPRILATYLNDFNAWRVPDAEKLIRRITNALTMLMDLAETPSVMHAEAGSQVQSEITRLRGKLQQLGGEVAVVQFEADRLVRTVPNSPSMQPLGLTRNFIVANEQLAHELMLDPNFQLEDTGVFPGQDDPMAALRRRSMHDEFWSDLEADFERNDFLNAYLALGSMGKTLLEAIESIRIADETSQMRVEVAELLDIERMQATNYLSEWSNCVELITKVVAIVMRVQYPAREVDSSAEWAALEPELAENDATEHGAVFSAVLRFAFKYSEYIRVDAANERLRFIAPVIQEHGVSYAQQKMQDKLNNGTLTLNHTKAFIKPQVDELKFKHFVQLARGDSTVLRKVHRSALVDLIGMDKTAPPLPEVFMYDQNRLKRFASEFKRLTDAAIIMRVISSFSPQSDSPLLQSDVDMQQEIETVLQQVTLDGETHQPVSLLCCISDMVLAHSPSCIEEIDILFGFIMQTKLPRIISPEDMQAMRVELRKVFEKDFEMRTTVVKRIETYLKDFTPLEADTDPLHSVYTINSFITQLARNLDVFATLNLRIHTPVINTVIKEMAKDAAGIPPEPVVAVQLAQALEAPVAEAPEVAVVDATEASVVNLQQ